MNTSLSEIKNFIRARVLSSSLMTDVPIFVDTEANIRGKISQAISDSAPGGTKTGVFGLITSISARDDSPGTLAPLTFRISVQFHEDPMVNRWCAENADKFNGVGKFAEHLANDAGYLIKSFVVDGVFICEPLEPCLTYVKSDFAPYAFQAVTDARCIQQDYTGNVAAPSMSQGGGLVTLTCPTSGSTIYYSTDSTIYPSQAAGATEYTAPFAESSGSKLYYCAYKSGLIPSYVRVQTMT